MLSAYTTAYTSPVSTLYKKKNSPFWYAQYFDADGERVSKSTKVPHKGKEKEKPSPTATRVANGFETEARKQRKGQGDLQKVFSSVIESASLAAGEKRLTLEAAKAYIEKLHRAANPDFVAVSLGKLFDQWIDGKSRRTAESTQKLYADAKRHLKDALGDKAFAAPAHLLTKRDIDKALGHLQDVGLRASTINLSLSVWKSVFREAVKDDVLTKNPAADVKGIPTTDSQKRAPFTPQEVRAMMAHADTTEEWRGLILVAAHSAIRMKDCSTLRKSNIVDGLIILKPSKTERLDKVISVPVTASLAAWIDAQPGDVLFPTLSTAKKATLSMGFKAIMARANVPATVTKPTGEVLVRSFHSLRHSANSWMANAGVDVGTRQEILGHSSAAQNQEYTTLDAETRRKAITLLPDLLAI